MRAVQSVLTQTYSNLEIIVVIDGPDKETLAALTSIEDRRLTIVALTEQGGGSRARNIGVFHAEGTWIAFLDDDDEWMPDKITRQLEAAERSGYDSPLVCCQVIARTPSADFIWPEKPPNKPYSEYLLVRSRLGYGEGLMQTSTLIAKRQLLLEMPFRDGLRKHQDWDWILRCTELRSVPIVYVEEPLAIWTLEQGRKRVSRENLWRHSYNWIRDSRHLVTKRAYGSFLATYVARQAGGERAWSAFFPLLKDILFTNIPRARDLAIFLAAFFIPPQWQDLLRRAVHARLARRPAI
jgi:glycosyltransferase involved in cell wall biosynthesis